MGTKSKETIRNLIAHEQANIASMKAQAANSSDKNYKAYIRNQIALAQGRIAQYKADLKNAK